MWLLQVFPLAVICGYPESFSKQEYWLVLGRSGIQQQRRMRQLALSSKTTVLFAAQVRCRPNRGLPSPSGRLRAALLERRLLRRRALDSSERSSFPR
jgi:hypothetical protein